MARSERDLRDRVRERAVALDQLRPGWAEGMGLDPDLAHFVQVLSSVTDADPFGERAEPIAAALADDGVAGSRLLARLHERAPELTAGPLDRERQFWVATGRTVVAAPDESLVQPVSADAASKPRDFGLFTSTGALGSLGMWGCYLELHRHSTLFPGPRTAWSLPSARRRGRERGRLGRARPTAPARAWRARPPGLGGRIGGGRRRTTQRARRRRCPGLEARVGRRHRRALVLGRGDNGLAALGVRGRAAGAAGPAARLDRALARGLRFGAAVAVAGGLLRRQAEEDRGQANDDVRHPHVRALVGETEDPGREREERAGADVEQVV